MSGDSLSQVLPKLYGNPGLISLYAKTSSPTTVKRSREPTYILAICERCCRVTGHPKPNSLGPVIFHHVFREVRGNRPLLGRMASQTDPESIKTMCFVGGSSSPEAQHSGSGDLYNWRAPSFRMRVLWSRGCHNWCRKIKSSPDLTPPPNELPTDTRNCCKIMPGTSTRANPAHPSARLTSPRNFAHNKAEGRGGVEKGTFPDASGENEAIGVGKGRGENGWSGATVR